MSSRRSNGAFSPRAVIGLSMLALACFAWSTSEAREPGGMRPHRAAMFRPMPPEGRAMRPVGVDRPDRAQRVAARNAAREGPPVRESPVSPAMPAREVPPIIQPPEPLAGPPARPGRLTPDERRALRQQINEAGRDVYRPIGP